MIDLLRGNTIFIKQPLLRKKQRMKFRIVLLLIPFVLMSCSEYQKVLKSTDPEYKYSKAIEFYEGREYTKASVLFNELVPVYKGTAKAEETLFLLADSYLKQRNYTMAGHYFEQFYRSFQATKRTEDAYFNRAYCYYKDSPTARLDQMDTRKGIDAFDLFLELFPRSEKAEEAQNYIGELEDKLVYKSFLNAKLYFDLGNYMGNNYQSAVIAAENSLKEYPDTKYREELSFLILKSKYIQAVNSVKEKQEDRYRETIDEYYSFMNDFPESKYKREANNMLDDSKKAVNMN